MSINYPPKTTKQDVIDYLKRMGEDEGFLEMRLDAFGGKNAEELAYEVGWRPVLGILRSVLE